MHGAPSKHESTLSKAETARRFLSAREVEQAAKAQAQELADATAAEMEELARSMVTITNTMSEVLTQIALSARSAGETTKEASKRLVTTAQEMEKTAKSWEATARVLQTRLADRSRRVLGAMLLSAAVGTASAALLHHYLPDLPTPATQPVIQIDTQKLAGEVISQWRRYQAESGNARAAER